MCDFSVHHELWEFCVHALWDFCWGGSRGGVQGSKDPPPPGPQRGGPGPLFQNEENSIYYLQFIKLLCYFPYPYLQKYILKILIDLQIDLGEKQKHIYLLCELHKITSRKYEGMFLLEKKWKNSVKMFYLLSCYNASEQLSGHQISKFSKPPAAYGSLRSPLPPATSS